MSERDERSGIVPVAGRLVFRDGVTDRMVCDALAPLPLPEDFGEIGDVPIRERAELLLRAFGWGYFDLYTDGTWWRISGIYGDWIWRDDVEASIRALAPLLRPGSMAFVPKDGQDTLRGEAIRWGERLVERTGDGRTVIDTIVVSWLKATGRVEWIDEHGFEVGDD